MKSGKKCHACRGPKLFRQRREGTRGSLDRNGRSSVSRPRSRHLTGTEQMISANVRRAPRMSRIGGGKPRSDSLCRSRSFRSTRSNAKTRAAGQRYSFGETPTSPAVTRVRPHPQRLPYARWRRRHVDVIDADAAQRVDDGIHHRGRRTDGTGLAHALDAKRIGGA